MNYCTKKFFFWECEKYICICLFEYQYSMNFSLKANYFIMNFQWVTAFFSQSKLTLLKLKYLIFNFELRKEQYLEQISRRIIIETLMKTQSIWEHIPNTNFLWPFILFHRQLNDAEGMTNWIHNYSPYWIINFYIYSWKIVTAWELFYRISCLPFTEK